MQLKAILLAIALTAVAGCGPTVSTSTSERTDSSQAPILVVKDSPFTFSMYPVYEKVGKSQLRLSITNNDIFQHNARVSAHLEAQDGHNSDVTFEENSELQRYVASVQLEHDEDYVIKTNIVLANENARLVKSPVFAFHCGDPIPEIFDVEGIGEEQNSKKK